MKILLVGTAGTGITRQLIAEAIERLNIEVVDADDIHMIRRIVVPDLSEINIAINGYDTFMDHSIEKWQGKSKRKMPKLK